MGTFIQRTTAPSENNAYYYADNPFYQSGYGLPNCTCYAFGRFWELTGGEMPSLSWGNAENWYGKSDGYSRGTTPKLGAVICWRVGAVGNGSDGAGHVAIVEQINADGSIVTSESGWDASSTFWRTTRQNDGNWGQSSAYTFQGFIYNPINFESGGTKPETKHPFAPYIWDYFMRKIGNEYGVAALMGNLEAESGLYPYVVQGDIPISDYSVQYTENVDNGVITEEEFVNNGPGGGGYGLAQWTFYTRKQELYDLCQSGGYSSIGSIELGCDFLWYELQTIFYGVLAVLKNTPDIRTASDKVLHDFENPANQSTAVEKKRASMGEAWYNIFTGTSGGGGTTPKKNNMPLLLLIAATRR